MYHYVEQMFLNNIFFGCEIWTEPPGLSLPISASKTEKLPTLVAKK